VSGRIIHGDATAEAWEERAPELVSCYSILGYRRDAPDSRDDLRRTRVPEWNLAKALRWAIRAGCDSVLVELTGTITADRNVTHHFCSDPGCPGGCEPLL
jgi:hypothetical protein